MSAIPPLPVALTLLTGLLLAAPSGAQSSARWVKDLNTTPATPYTPSRANPSRSTPRWYDQSWLRMGSYFYFTAQTFKSGSELFRSDGKTATLVKDIEKGPWSSGPSNLTLVGKKIYFTAYGPKAGFELWVTDGSSAGTRLVKDITPGISGSTISNMAAVNGKLVFALNEKKTGLEPWVSDGTAAGTKLLKDVSAGSYSSVSQSAHEPIFTSNAAGTQLFFLASVLGKGRELWVTDGTTSGTKIARDIYPGAKSAFRSVSWAQPFRKLGANKIIFEANDGTHGSELWISDGTPAGTKLVKDIYVLGRVGTGVDMRSSVSLGNKVVFAARTLRSRIGYEPWITDGTSAGTKLLKDVLPGGNGSLDSYQSWQACFANGKAYWVCTATPGSYEIWSTDGTTAGTKLFSTAKLTTSRIFNLATAGGKVFFCGNNITAGTGWELCIADGKTTKTVKDIKPGSATGVGSGYNHISRINKDTIAFAADDGTGLDLWVSKGTAKTTINVDVNKWVGPLPTEDDQVSGIVSLFGKILFAATDGTDKTKGQHGKELWISDGTSANTKLLKDIYIGSSTTKSSSSNPSSLCRLGNYVYFSATDGSNGYELWRTDGSATGTKMFKNIALRSRSSFPKGLTRIGNKIYFSASTRFRGTELWVTDGTFSGTKLVKDIFSGSASSSPKNFARLGKTNKVLFSAYHYWTFSGSGTELWISDGTSAGTKMVKDIYTGNVSSNPEYLTSYKGKVYFQCRTKASGTELWQSDGTAAGTRIVKEGVAGTGSGFARFISRQGGKLIYQAYTLASGYELHSSDGTAANTGLLVEFNAGKTSSVPTYLTPVGSRYVYCQAGIQNVGFKLVRYDVVSKSMKIVDLNQRGGGFSPGNQASGRARFAVDSGSVYGQASKTIIGDRQLFFVVNGATAHPIGRVQASSELRATDPVIGKGMIVSSESTVSNALDVLLIGIADGKPDAIGPLAMGSFAYFDLAKPVAILTILGKSKTATLPVPNDVTLIGDHAVIQAFVIDSAAFPLKTEVSNGVHITFGR